MQHAKALYVKLDQQTWEELQRSADAERRLIPDQAAVLLRRVLVEQQQQTEAALAAH